ncbi:MAG: CidA/LrgA family protein [Beijerinckiaceae bacterium]
MLEALLILFASQLAGEAAARLLALSVPGPVIGMVLLLLGLRIRAALRPDAMSVKSEPLGIATTFILANLSLLFVPAGVGIIAHLPVLASHGLGLLVALVVSTLLSLVVTALTFDTLAKRFGGEERS